MIMLIKAALIYSFIFSSLVIIGSLFWVPTFPWITFAIIGSFFVIPWQKWVVPALADPKKRINKPPRPPVE